MNGPKFEVKSLKKFERSLFNSLKFPKPFPFKSWYKTDVYASS